MAPELLCLLGTREVPELFEVVLEHIDVGQALVGVEQFLKADAIAFARDVLLVAQQQPAGAFDDLAGGVVVLDAVSRLVRNVPVLTH